MSPKDPPAPLAARNMQAPADAEPFQDTPLRAAIRCAFDNPTIVNIEGVALAAADQRVTPPLPSQEPIAHICSGDGKIKPYETTVCSLCRAANGVDLSLRQLVEQLNIAITINTDQRVTPAERCIHGNILGACPWCDLRDDGGLPEAQGPHVTAEQRAAHWEKMARTLQKKMSLNEQDHLAHVEQLQQRVTTAEQKLKEAMPRDVSRGDGLSTIDQHSELPRQATSDSDRRLPEKP